jgi:7,8-dihydropterin-6-yl-methyl-4-(beta-D-ribofuranosyl)aminobenzene 5'-phosphate synthase
MTTLAGEYGLSLHLESAKGGSKAQFLLDFGYTPEVLNRNFDLLDIDPTRINGLILSHGHRDHYGGLAGFIGQHRTRMPSELSLFVGGEDVFREKWIKRGNSDDMVSWGAPDRMGLTAQNVSQVCCETPHALAGPFTTGFIERQSFENVTGGTMVEDYDHFSDEERRGKLVKDQHPGEHATCYIVQGRGLVVISSCGHAGIINTVKTAMAVANVDKLHAVLGGFHLGLAPPEYIEHTITEFETLAPDVVVPMHCTGTPFVEMMRQRMPDSLVTSYVGSRFTFGV